MRKPLPPKAAPPGPTSLQLELPDGLWQADWVTMRGNLEKGEQLRGGGVRSIESPPYEVDIALRVKRVGI